jgi:hypothetical protein
MIERDLRDGLDYAVAAEPPLSFDPDELMARAERQSKRRRSLAGVGVATAVIAVAAVALPTVLHTGSARGVAAAAGPSVAVTPQYSSHPTPTEAWPPAGVAPKDYGVDELRSFGTAWTKELTDKFAELVPGASDVSVQPWGGEASGQVFAGQRYLDTFVQFELKGTKEAVAVQVEAPGNHTTSPAADCVDQRKDVSCQTSWQGSTALVIQTTTGAQTGSKARLVNVSQYRADGSVVSATAYNYNPIIVGTPKSDTQATSSTLPVTTQQLTALATDPAFSF